MEIYYYHERCIFRHYTSVEQWKAKIDSLINVPESSRFASVYAIIDCIFILISISFLGELIYSIYPISSILILVPLEKVVVQQTRSDHFVPDRLATKIQTIDKVTSS